MNKPPLWEIVNSLYHGVMDRMPQVLQERDMASAFVLGVAGTYGIFRFGRFLSRNLGNYYPQNYLAVLKEKEELEFTLMIF